MSKRSRNTAKTRRLIVPVAVYLLSIAMAPAALAESAQERYDWIPADELTDAQKAHLSPACRGAYIDPLAGKSSDDNLAETPIFVDANQSLMSAGAIQLKGNVAILQGNRRIKAGFMAFDRKTDHAELRDDVEIRQPGILVRGEGAEVNMAGREAQFVGGEFVLHGDHLRGSAGKIEHQSDGVVVLNNGQLTSCEPGRETWLIKGQELRIDPNKKQGSGKNVTIEVVGVPIIYVPYITFPVGEERQSGLLIPAIGTSEGGLDLTLPYYWNIAPNYDATLSPRYAEGHGSMIETEWRYMNAMSHNVLNLAYLSNDQGGGDPDADKLIASGVDESLLRPYKGEDRWLMSLNHNGGDNSRWYSDIRYSKVSDVDYFRDISPETFDLANSTFLNQSATLGYRLPNWNISTRLQAYQNLLVDLDPSYRQLPRVQMNGRYTWGSLGLSLNHEWVSFTHEDESYITGQRASIDYQWEWNQQWQWGYVRPKLGLQSLAYHLNSSNLSTAANATPMVTSPYVGVDAGLVFEREDGRQTLEPRVFYLYRDPADHSDLYNVTNPAFGEVRDVNFDTTPLTFGYDQLFRDRRFAGGDRIGDANQLAVGLTTQWLDQYGAATLASISVGQVIYFRDREVSLNYNQQAQTIQESDLATKITAQVSNNIQLRGDFLYNPKSDQMMRATTGIEYQDSASRRLKLGYRFVREDLIERSTLSVDQFDTAFSLPFGDQWRLVGRLFYDLDEHKELDAFFGFEYDDCCYRLRVLARRWLDSQMAARVSDEKDYYDDGLFLEVDLKGLASSGKSIQKLLSDSIPGFRE